MPSDVRAASAATCPGEGRTMSRHARSHRHARVKRRIGLLLASVLGAWSWLLVASEPLGADPDPSRGLLFQVRPTDGTAPSVLFGTIHSEDPRVIALPEPVRDAFESSPRVALEVVPDSAAIIKAMIAMTYTDGRLLRDALPSDLYEETAAALTEIGMTDEAFKDIKPWAVVTMLSAPPSETGEFLDMMLYRRALDAGQELAGLETMAEQLAVFEGLSATDQVALLRETLASRGDLPEVFDALIEAYLERDLVALQRLSDAYLADSDPALAALFQDIVIDERNRRMVERMEPLLAQGQWFIAVGALHLPGPEGILELLRDRGYEVTVVY
jgi:uncharacterized protein YbaP (TraB family)